MRAVGIIPARYDATRFPGKPPAEISGLPMLQHVWRGARRAKRLGDVPADLGAVESRLRGRS